MSKRTTTRERIGFPVSGFAMDSTIRHHAEAPKPNADTHAFWLRVARTVLTSRALDRIEEQEMAPKGLVTYQFSARGHDLAQAILSEFITHPHDGATCYYRSRPFVLGQGLTAEEAFRGSLARAGGMTDGRDIGVVHLLPRRERGTVLPASGDVGAQYSPGAGWAQSIGYYANILKDESYRGAIDVSLGGDASTATNGFWAALNIATTLQLPMLFFIEDNGFGISVTSDFQTPGRNIAKNLAAFTDLQLFECKGYEPEEAEKNIREAVEYVRKWQGPALIRVEVPRLSGHSFTDTQSYKSPELRALEESHDPLPKLEAFLTKSILSKKEWADLVDEVGRNVRSAADRALSAPVPDAEIVLQHVFASASNQPTTSTTSQEAKEAGPRMNLQDAVRKVLETELAKNPKLLIFGEDVGAKGGVHGATVDLQREFGAGRVFDTSLNEEGIIGRSVGMAMAGLKPVPEIQFRKYADPATEQINDCGTIRWRTLSKFSAPVVVRIPVGFGKKTGDPWHSVSGEAMFAHTIGWRIAYPSNAEDATGLLRSALRGDDPTFFFEHRALLDTAPARSNYPGDEFVIPFGNARIHREGKRATIITWGAMVDRATVATEGMDVEIIDMRTIVPWDKEAVLASVKKTNRVLVLHEDGWTCGFGGEIAATISQQAFPFLDAPVERLAVPDCPVPYNTTLMDSVVPTVAVIRETLVRLLEF
ncbi:MAG TPA: transketolase C-terminal domain-containing protein [Candidatus Kapabacteria bacterium]|nr:transketolase C-terminal domain-containing protein [Candidatus Kapabacteria bacterium]